MMTERRESRGLWPSFYTTGGATKVARQAVYFAMLLIAATTFIAIVSQTPLLFVDVAVIALLAFGIWKMSKVAAMIALIYYAGSSILVLASGDFRLSTVFIRLIGILIFVNGLRATFAYHDLALREERMIGRPRS